MKVLRTDKVSPKGKKRCKLRNKESKMTIDKEGIVKIMKEFYRELYAIHIKEIIGYESGPRGHFRNHNLWNPEVNFDYKK